MMEKIAPMNLRHILALTCLVGLLAPWRISAANEAPTKLGMVWSFIHEGLVYPCYDQTFAIIYFKYDATRKVSSIWKKELNGEEHVVAEFPGVRDERSLSCSQDGQTISAFATTDIKMTERLLILLRGKDSARYSSRYWSYSRSGVYSLLAPDGMSIALPMEMTLVAGKDLLQEMNIFPDKVGEVFFMDGYVYEERDNVIHKYLAVDGEWKELGQPIKHPQDFSPNEIARCGDHELTSLVGDESTRFMVLGDTPRGKQDWLARIGVRNLFRKYIEPLNLTNSYGACVFPLLRRHTLKTVVGLARVDEHGLRTFSLPYAEASLLNDDVFFSKDGCYALIQLVGSEVQLLRVETQQCQQSKG